MKINKQLKKDIGLAIKVSLDKGKVLPSKTAKFIKLFKGLPLPQAIQSLTLYKKGLSREIMAKTLIVESVIPLSGEDLGKIKKGASKNFSVLETKNILNKSLLGGLRIKIGDVLIDDSISGRIGQVKETIAG